MYRYVLDGKSALAWESPLMFIFILTISESRWQFCITIGVQILMYGLYQNHFNEICKTLQNRARHNVLLDWAPVRTSSEKQQVGTCSVHPCLERYKIYIGLLPEAVGVFQVDLLVLISD